MKKNDYRAQKDQAEPDGADRIACRRAFPPMGRGRGNKRKRQDCPSWRQSLLVFVLAVTLTHFFGLAGGAAPVWQAQGPSPIVGSLGVTGIADRPVVGAIQTVLGHPAQAGTIYVGTVNGGVWKTTNGGVNWTPLTDHEASLSIGALAFDVSDPDRLVAGLAVFSNSRGSGGPRRGLMGSSDGGNTWKPLGSPFLNDTEISSLLVNKQTIWAASRKFLDETPGGKLGLFLSLDGGTSFQVISGSGGLPEGGITSLAWDPRNYNRVYAAVTQKGIFRSDNGGRTWTRVSVPGMNIQDQTANILLSVGAGGQSLFAAIARTYPGPVTEKGPKERLESVWRSLDGGRTWLNMGGQGGGVSKGLPGSTEDTGFFGVNPGSQADINLSLLADPSNPNLVYIGGDTQPAKNEGEEGVDPVFPNSIGAQGYTGRLFRGDASQPLGQQWTPITDNYTTPKSGPHADARWMAFDVRGNLLQVDDGGIYRRTSPGTSQGRWQSLNGDLQITEFYPQAVAFDRNTRTLIGGNQDNGVAAQRAPGGLVWDAAWSGDGGRVAVNDSQPDFSVRYGSSQNLGNFGRYKVDGDNKVIEEKLADLLVGNLTLKDYEKARGSTIPFITPMVLNQGDKSRLAFGTQRIYLAQDRVNQRLSDSLQLTDISRINFQGEVGALAYGRPGNPDLLLVGEGPRLWLSTNLSPGSLRQLTNYESREVQSGGNALVTHVLINPTTASGARESFFVADGYTLQASGDNGATWGWTISLPQLTSLQFITAGGKNAVVAGGYSALYASRCTDMVNWISLMGNLPGTLIASLDYSHDHDLLVVGTMGRGAFTLERASTYIPDRAPQNVDAGWLRLVDDSSPSQTLNGGLVQAVDPLNWRQNLTLTSRGGSLDTNYFDCRLAGRISGTGALTKLGEGVLSLAAANTYSGGTIFAQGTVKVTQNANLGAATGGLTFTGGTLELGADLTTARSLLVDYAGGILDLQNFTATLKGPLRGEGLLIFRGNGHTLFSGDGSNFSGALMTHPDTLEQTFTLGPAGRLSSTGMLANFTNQGVLDPGESPGTLHIWGTYTQQSDGELIVEIESPSSYDTIEVIGAPGTAHLAGGLTPKLLDGYVPKLNQVFPGIVETSGGLSGNFADINNSRITRTLFWQPRYTNFSFDLQAIGNYAAPDLGLSANQWAVGNMLNGLSPTARGDLAAVLDTINTFTSNRAVQEALQEISPGKYAVLPSLTFPLTHMVLRQWQDRLSYLRWENQGDSGLIQAGGPGFSRGFTLSYANGGMMASQAFASDAGGPGRTRPRLGVYLEPLVAWGNQDATANQVSYRYLNTGFTLGMDYRLRDNLLVGLGTGYYRTSTHVGGTGGDIDVNSVPVTAYAAWQPGGYYLNGALGYAYHDYDLVRNITFGGIARTARASTHGNQIHAAVETGYDLKIGRVIVSPKASLNYISLETRSFTERNAGALNLAVAKQSAESLQTGLGGRLAGQGQVGQVTLTPQVYAVWQHEFSNRSRGISASLAPGGAPFTFQTDAPSRDFAVLGADLAARFSKKLTARVGYNAEVGRGGTVYQGVTAGLRLEF